MDHEEIIELTREYGKGFGENHSLRLLHLVSILGEGMEYNQEAVWLAAYLHDWGGYPAWMVQGVEHYDRSAEVARDFLKERNCPQELMDLVIEIIKNHHGGSPDRSIESRLFTDADALDLLGAIGVCRMFSMAPRDLKLALQVVDKYRAGSIAAITTDKGKKMAEERIKETDEILRKFHEESFGYV